MEEWSKAVVRVWRQRPQEADVFLGTAFLIAPGYVLTARHVVENVSANELKLQGQAWSGTQGVEEIERHPDRDVAILRLKKATKDVVCIPLKNSEDANLPVGTKILLAGYCQSAPQADVHTPPITISSHDGVCDLEVAHSSIAKGMSGGPAVKDGKVVGLISGRHHDENKTYLLRLNAFRDFLAEHIDLQTVSPKGPGKLYGVPQLPPHFLERPETLAGLKAKLLHSGKQAIALTSAQKIGIHGMGGIGKSVLAAALTQDKEVQQAFPNGIFWLILGQTPDLVARQLQVAKTLSGQKEAFVDAQEGKARLQELLEYRKCLLILDDAWEMSHISVFNVLGEDSQLLVTTRNANLIAGLGGETYDLNLLSPEQARELLSTWSKQTDLPPQADEIIKECGYLPLAVAMVGAMLREACSEEDWDDVLGLLRNAELEEIEQAFPDYEYPNLFRALQVSVNALAPDIREHYLDFAVFPEDTPVPVKVLETFWAYQGLKRFHVKKILRTLRDRSLLRWDENDALTLHDLQRDYICSQTRDELPALHQRLLDAYKAVIPSKTEIQWGNGPNDGYFFENICYHLYEAGAVQELHDLLFHFSWLQTKLETCGVNALLSDYDTLPQEEELRLLKLALQLSAHILTHDPTQLPSQLHGRLCAQTIPVLTNFLARVHSQSFWLRPLMSTFTQAGGTLLRTFPGHELGIYAVAVTPDGRQVVSASDDKTLKVWDLASGVEKYTLTGHRKSVNAVVVATTPEGWRVFSASDDGTVREWDLNSGEKVRIFKGHMYWVTAVAVDPYGRLLVSASEDKTLKVWDLTHGKELFTLTGHTARINAVAVTPDGRQAISASRDTTLKVWNLSNGQEQYTLTGHTHSVNTVAVTLNGQQVVSASEDRTIKIWNLASGEVQHNLTGHADSVTAVAVIPNKRQVVSASWDRTIKIWNLENGEVQRTLTDRTGRIDAVAVAPGGNLLVSASMDDKTLKVWNLGVNEKRRSQAEHTNRVTAIAAIPDGRRVVSASYDTTLKVWDLDSGKVRQTLIGHTHLVNAVAVTPDSQRAVSASEDKTLKVWNLDSGKVLQTLAGHSTKVSAVALTPNGRQAVSASFDGTLKIWDLDSGRIQQVFTGHTFSPTAVTVTPDGQQVVSGSFRGIVKLWNMTSGEEQCTFNGHSNKVSAVAVTPDGRKIVSASYDQTLKVWDLHSGDELQTLIGHTNQITAMTVSPDGLKLVSASADRTLKVWDIDTGSLLTTFTADAYLWCCAITPDGLIIVAGDQVGTVHFLKMENGKW